MMAIMLLGWGGKLLLIYKRLEITIHRQALRKTVTVQTFK